MSRAVKEAGAVGDFVAANKVPIATGATAMVLAALLSKRNRLAKALGWGAVGAGLGKAGQLYLDAYKSSKGMPEADRDAFEKAKQQASRDAFEKTLSAFEKDLSATDGADLTAQPSYDLIPLGFNYDPKNHGGKEYGQDQPVAGVTFRERGDNREPIPSKVPSMPLTSTDYLKRPADPVQGPIPGFNPDLTVHPNPRIQAAIQGVKLPQKQSMPLASTDYLRAPQPGSPFVAETPGWLAGATPAGFAGIVERARQRRAKQQASRAAQMAKMQQRLPGTEMLKDTAKETARILAAPAVSYVDKVTGHARDIAEALGKSAEGRKNIKRLELDRRAQLKWRRYLRERLEAERKAQLKRQQEELGHVPRTPIQKLDNLLYRLLSK